MKIARLNFFFKLPDDFHGDINDVLEEIIKYRKKHSKKAMTESTPMAQELENSKTISKKGYDEIMFARFSKLTVEGFRIHGEVNLCEYDPNTKIATPIK